MAAPYQRRYKVSYWDTDMFLLASPLALLGYMEETATWHSEEVGNSLSYLREQGKAWLLHQVRLKVERYPRWREEIKVSTWVEDIRRCFAHRHFEIEGEGGALAWAATLWILVDLFTHKPCSIPSSIGDPYGRLFRGTVDLTLTSRSFSFPDKISGEKFVAGVADLDLNFHVNHKKYLYWVLNTLPQELYRECFLSDVEILYKRETGWGEGVFCYTQKIYPSSSKSFLHFLYTRDKELALASTLWKRRGNKPEKGWLRNSVLSPESSLLP